MDGGLGITGKYKVKREILIVAIRNKKAQAIGRREEAIAAWPGELEAWKEEKIARLEDEIARVRSGKYQGYDGPTKKPEPLNTEKFDQDIAFLSAVEDEYAIVGADDFGRYLI